MSDYKLMLKRQNKNDIQMTNQKDPQYMVDSINKLLKFTPSYLNWLSVLQHLYLTTSILQSFKITIKTNQKLLISSFFKIQEK